MACISTKNSLTTIIHQGNLQKHCYCIEYLSHRIFGEYVLRVSHMPYAEDFAHFGQKD